MKVNWKFLLVNIAIALLVGGLAGILTSGSVYIYQEINVPDFSPPGFVFPIVWTILYILMGVSAYLIHQSEESNEKEDALLIYRIQLFLNFMWSLIFFNLQAYLFAFVILVVLWVAILVMIVRFYNINPLAGKLQIPYLVWVTFAGILNLAIVILN